MKGHVKFNRVKEETEELVYDVVNKNDENLGQIYLSRDWNKYVFEIGGVYFDRDCLNQIAGMLFHLDQEPFIFYEKAVSDAIDKTLLSEKSIVVESLNVSLSLSSNPIVQTSVAPAYQSTTLSPAFPSPIIKSFKN